MRKTNGQNPAPSNTTKPSSASTAGKDTAEVAKEALEGTRPPVEGTDALPNTDERQMGGNPVNPDVNVLADTTNEGLAPGHADQKTVVSEEDAAASSVANQNALQIYENQLAILKRDNEQLIADNRTGRALVRRFYDALGIAPEDDLETRVKEQKAEMDGLRERVGSLQIALGIGPGDDPERAAGALKSRNRLADVDPTSHLPAYGHLLLMTSLARVHPTLRGFYNAVPTEIKTDDGDVWISRVEETLEEDGTPIRNVVIRHEPNAFAIADAKARKLRLETELAEALGRETSSAKLNEKGKNHRDQIVRDRTAGNLKDASRRVKDIRAELEEIAEKAQDQEAREWRFNADLDGYSLKGEA